VPDSLSRRDLLRRGGVIAAGAGIAALAPLYRLPFVDGELAQDTRVSGPMRKCISLGGPGPLRGDADPDDYRLWGNRDYVKDSGTDWVKLWISWSDFQSELERAPSDRASSWEQLDKAPRGESWMRRLDRQLKAANDDGVGTIVTLFQAFPAWAGGADGPDPVTGTKPPEQRIPIDLSADGPWSWFVGYLCARYRKDGGGNPDGAWIDALEICNEPNLLFWPQEGIGQAVAKMLRSATQVSSALDGPDILGPGTSDFPDRNQEKQRGLVATDWRTFTRDVLKALGSFSPGVPVHWSHHNFNDVKRIRTPSRVETVLELLADEGWVSHVKPLWLTEGGFNLYPDPGDRGRKQRQAELIERSFRRMRQVPQVYMWTQHTITDKAGNDFQSGLRDDFVPDKGPGPRRPAWFAWKGLPGAGEL
jgi:hypothetical protein